MKRSVEQLVSDLWVVDLRGGAHVISCRAPQKRSTVGQNLLTMLSGEEISRLSAELISYDLMPIVSETLDGRVLIVLPSIVPSSTMAIFLVPNLDRKMTLRFLLKRSGVKFSWNDSMYAEASGRMPGKVERYADQLKALVEEIEALDFSKLAPFCRGEDRRFGKFLKERIRLLAAMAGCSLRWSDTDPMVDSEYFDFGMAHCVFLISFLLCRSCSIDGVSTVGWKDGRITLSFAVREMTGELQWGIDAIEACVDDRLMYSFHQLSDGRLDLFWMLHRPELSYLGLKAPNSLA